MYRNLESRMIAPYYDSHGILWIGTDGGGVIWSDLRMQFYNCFYQDRQYENLFSKDDDSLSFGYHTKGICGAEQRLILKKDSFRGEMKM